MGKKEEIGRLIRTMRRSRDITQEELAKAIGKSPSSITMYETGRREPDFETLEALADVFNVPLQFLIPSKDDDIPVEERPVNEQVRSIVRILNKMNPDTVEQVESMLHVFYEKSNPELFEKGTDHHDA